MKTAFTETISKRTLPIDLVASAVPREASITVEAATVAGAASGVAVGAIGGPVGVILGGIIGSTVGFVAGSTLDAAQKRADAHDSELDDAIGVTEGDLGAREKAKTGLDAERQGLLLVDRELSTAAEVLRGEHAHLERVFAKLLEAYRQGDWNDVRASWNLFESGLRAHMETEEALVFPAFREATPDEARALLEEHDGLRRMLETLGMNIELHAVPELDAEGLVRRVGAHGEREERVLYPWIDVAFGRAPLTAVG